MLRPVLGAASAGSPLSVAGVEAGIAGGCLDPAPLLAVADLEVDFASRNDDLARLEGALGGNGERLLLELGAGVGGELHAMVQPNGVAAVI